VLATKKNCEHEQLYGSTDITLLFAINKNLTQNNKRVSLLYRTAQLLILAAFLPWGDSKELVV